MSAKPLVHGRAAGNVVAANEPLSFWGGIDPASGVVIDQHHSLAGQTVAGQVLAISNGRGSCTGSQVLLELAVRRVPSF